MYNLQPFIVSASQFLLFYSSTGNDIIIQGDHNYMIPIICFCSAFTTTNLPINSDIDYNLIHDLLVFLILPTTAMLLYSGGHDTTTFTFNHSDIAAIFSFCIKIYRLFYF